MWRRARPVIRYYCGVFDVIECWRRTGRGAARTINQLRDHIDPKDRDKYSWDWAQWSRADLEAAHWWNHRGRR